MSQAFADWRGLLREPEGALPLAACAAHPEVYEARKRGKILSDMHVPAVCMSFGVAPILTLGLCWWMKRSHLLNGVRTIGLMALNANHLLRV
ncbi:hypothetical protein O2N63_00470 [Aliiroseovarius sp. KMU-50]|uniref:Uncharacterized protein n=1 Tax=Aliiroseovarius salicola TaxID=3009082 RepID=A0ABT4VWE8_9RHOB|nr:hypothetical protein [Aliiroseovarius sp. KMU-50]MDA5092563.1 hypothetical protein [Aliiroseovarius sp. KMU-50]